MLSHLSRDLINITIWVGDQGESKSGLLPSFPVELTLKIENSNKGDDSELYLFSRKDLKMLWQCCVLNLVGDGWDDEVRLIFRNT